MKKGLYYLAAPYHGTTDEMAARFELSLATTSAFLKQGIHVFSPIIYVNQIATQIDFSSLEERRNTVMPYLLEFLETSAGMILMNDENWQKSWGVRQELLFCQAHSIPVHVMSPELVNKSLNKVFEEERDVSELLAIAA